MKHSIQSVYCVLTYHRNAGDYYFIINFIIQLQTKLDIYIRQATNLASFL